MQPLNFSITINASAAKVWQVLWTDSTYRQWTSVFHEGSHAVSDWKEGSKILFITPEGSGMFSQITESRANEYMAFKHLGEIKNFVEQPESEATKSWSGAMETYSLKENNGITILEVNVDSSNNYEYVEFFKNVFPKALEIVKDLSMKPFFIEIEAQINAPIEKVWNHWTKPEHIVKWNNASDDWHTPKAENDLRVGGKFNSRMEAKDGSFGFDFWGIYNEVKTNEIISYEMGDGRKAKINFSNSGNTTKITETFEAETENSVEMQKFGWQAILNNFKKYSESN